MLVLTRKAGESIMIGGLRLTVDHVYEDFAIVVFQNKNLQIVKRLSATSPLVIGDVEVKFEKVRKSKVRLAIKAPREIKVWRAETCLSARSTE